MSEFDMDLECGVLDKKNVAIYRICFGKMFRNNTRSRLIRLFNRFLANGSYAPKGDKFWTNVSLLRITFLPRHSTTFRTILTTSSRFSPELCTFS